MAQGMLQQFGQGEAALVKPGLAWDTDKLLFVVREPFVSKTSGADIVCGLITADQPLIVESTMPEGGVIFSDGVTADYLAFNSSTIATIGLAQRQTQLIVG
jgi:hypothetical protein